MPVLRHFLRGFVALEPVFTKLLSCVRKGQLYRAVVVATSRGCSGRWDNETQVDVETDSPRELIVKTRREPCGRDHAQCLTVTNSASQTRPRGTPYTRAWTHRDVSAFAHGHTAGL